MLESHFSDAQTSSENTWIFSTSTPSLADISLYYQLAWGMDIAAGRGINNLTGGGTPDTNTDGASAIFNKERYPLITAWYEAFEKYMNSLPVVEAKVNELSDKLLSGLRQCERTKEPKLLKLAVGKHTTLDGKLGLTNGTQVSVVPDDTGRGK